MVDQPPSLSRHLGLGERIESAAANASPVDPVRVAAILVSAAIILAALYYGRDILVPLALAFLLSFALNPAVTRLRRLGLPQIVAVITVMTVVFCVLAGFALILGSQVRTLSVELPNYQSTMRTKLASLRESLNAPGMFDGALKTIDTLQKEVEEKKEPPQANGAKAQPVEIVPTQESAFHQALTWLGRAAEPLATAGIVVVFVFLALLDRLDLRDRFVRMLGANIHRSTDAMDEAGARISKYLLMQLIVNTTYGAPIALGLWLIGVPGAILWGTVAATMRFVPYVGPAISAIFPIALAFAIDPGWHMVLWTVALIVTLELVSNNIVEPLLYGSSTGLSAMSLIAAAIFWTALWGPIGLVLSTPLTVCVLVIGRHLPQLQFLDVLLGSAPALDLPTRVYQRLIANDPDEAIDIANTAIESSSVTEFYNDVGIEVLRQASEDHGGVATAEHRLRISNGMDALLEDIGEQYPPKIDPLQRPSVVCIGGKWEIDTIAAMMLTQALLLKEIAAHARPAASINADYIAKLDLEGAKTVCLSYFSSEPAIPARHFCRRLRRRWPDLKIVLALWNSRAELLTDEKIKSIGADEVVTSIDEAVQRIHQMLSPGPEQDFLQPEIPDNDAERVNALHATGILDGHAQEDLDALAKRAADVFNTDFAMISLIDETREIVAGKSGTLPRNLTDDFGKMVSMPRDHSICGHVIADGETLVIPDIERDPRFADNPALDIRGVRFYAGAPLRTKEGYVLGTLCVLDPEPRTPDESEVKLLESMAADAMQIITPDKIGEEIPTKQKKQASTATLGQAIPK
ncbi:MAG: hypothetical protein BGP05_22665 [Rhizobiales bacterium 62-47]|nr:AI-2E family transporter [Hyphomicrobiales bacterium]OJY10457.1 MAG: hypothetical protein BGP05_22665 [Rhizobiales bacterium 62-47]